MPFDSNTLSHSEHYLKFQIYLKHNAYKTKLRDAEIYFETKKFMRSALGTSNCVGQRKHERQKKLRCDALLGQTSTDSTASSGAGIIQNKVKELGYVHPGINQSLDSGCPKEEDVTVGKMALFRVGQSLAGILIIICQLSTFQPLG